MPVISFLNSPLRTKMFCWPLHSLLSRVTWVNVDRERPVLKIDFSLHWLNLEHKIYFYESQIGVQDQFRHKIKTIFNYVPTIFRKFSENFQLCSIIYSNVLKCSTIFTKFTAYFWNVLQFSTNLQHISEIFNNFHQIYSIFLKISTIFNKFQQGSKMFLIFSRQWKRGRGRCRQRNARFGQEKQEEQEKVNKDFLNFHVGTQKMNFRRTMLRDQIRIDSMEMMARVSTSDNLYLIQTVLSPKRYWRIIGGTVVYISKTVIDADRWN
jgi:hypothetical protein